MSVQSSGRGYDGYERWKNWTSLFTFDADRAGYFEGELRGTAIKNSQVLELGFGAGDFLAWARSRGAIVAGTEVNDVLLASARQHGIELLPAAIETVAADHAARFDTIFAFDVFEHLELGEIKTALSACATMLKPGGHLVLRFPNAQSPFGLPPQNGDVTHRTRLSRSVFEQIVDDRLFSIERYAAAYRFTGSGLRQQLMRRIRGAVQDAITFALNAVYSQNIPWSPVVVLVLRRQAHSLASADSRIQTPPEP